MDMNDILINGVETADPKRIEYALKHGADVNFSTKVSKLSSPKTWETLGFNQVTPLAIAICQKNQHIVDILAQHRASLNTPVTANNITFSNLLAFAALRSNYKTFATLLNYAKTEDIENAQLVFKGEAHSLPHVLVTVSSIYEEKKRPQILEDLLQRGFNANQKDAHGYTLAMEAAHHKKFDELIIVLKHGGNPFEPYPQSKSSPYDELFNNSNLEIKREDYPKLEEIRKLCAAIKEKQNSAATNKAIPSKDNHR